jgi:hypothetical protein
MTRHSWLNVKTDSRPTDLYRVTITIRSARLTITPPWLLSLKWPPSHLLRLRPNGTWAMRLVRAAGNGLTDREIVPMCLPDMPAMDLHAHCTHQLLRACDFLPYCSRT